MIRFSTARLAGAGAPHWAGQLDALPGPQVGKGKEQSSGARRVFLFRGSAPDRRI